MNEEPPPPLPAFPYPSLSLACSLVFHGKFALACHCVPSAPTSPPPPSQTGGRPHRDCPLKQIPERLTRDPPHIFVVVRRMDTETRRWADPSPPDIQQGLNNKSEDRHAYYVSLLVGSKTTDHGPQLTLCVDRRPTFLEIRY